MSGLPCSMCRRRKPSEKYASAYWAWFREDGERSAWKLLYCFECAPASLALLSADGSMGETGDASTCLGCGVELTLDETALLFCTLFLPGKERMEYALALCPACAAKSRQPLIENGRRLPNREEKVRGPSPSTSVWDSLGLSPNASN